MIAPISIFNPGADRITDFSKMSAGSIFNEVLVPHVNSFDSILQEGDSQRNKELERNLEQDVYRTQADDAFLTNNIKPIPAVANDPDVDYNAPIQSQSNMVTPTSQKGGYKLSNYGYDSDSSPDHNSNVLRIGHSNNRLDDGVSAALTKSLAKRYGLKTGDFFEAVTADGKVLKRRYDDTVPTTYKGKPLPETVDLYERNGKNSFGGKVLTIRPL